MIQPTGAGGSLSRSPGQLVCSGRANSAHVRQSGRESGPGLQIKVFQNV